MTRYIVYFCGALVMLLANCSRDLDQFSSEIIPPPADFADPLLICTELKPEDHARAFGPSSLFWEKSSLRVRFLGGSEFLQLKVIQYAREWSKYANIHFQFVRSEPSDIRISFESESGSWSYIGRTSQYIPSTTATMNFGWFNSQTSDTEFRRTTLHEFGHALGLSHEHQHPEAGIPWNRDAVYAYYSRTQDWSRNDVDHNIFRKYSRSSTRYSAYDPNSIMHYYIPQALVFGNWTSNWNTHLSATDISFIQSVYPDTNPPQVGCEQCPDSLNVVACDDFEQYDQLTFGTSRSWKKWSPDAPNGELQSYSWGKVLKIEAEANSRPDVIYTPGQWSNDQLITSWNMFVGSQNSAYFNVQKQEQAGQEFGAQFYFNTDETGSIEVNGRSLSFDYEQRKWIRIQLFFDFDRDLMSFLLNGKEMALWPLSWNAQKAHGARQFSALNFYAVDENSRFWLDDFCVGRPVGSSQNLGPMKLSDWTASNTLPRIMSQSISN